MTDKFELATVQKELATTETELAKAKEKIGGYRNLLEEEKQARNAMRKEIDGLKTQIASVDQERSHGESATWVYRASTMSMAALLGILLASIGDWNAGARLLLIIAGSALVFFSVLLVFKLSLKAKKKSVTGFFGIFGTLWFVCEAAIGVLIIGLNLSSLEIIQEATKRIATSTRKYAEEAETAKTKSEDQTPIEPVAKTEAAIPQDSKVTATIQDAEAAANEGKYVLAVSIYNQVIKQSEEHGLKEMKMASVIGLCTTLQKMGKGQEALKTVAKYRKWVEDTFAKPTEDSIRFFVKDAEILWAANLNARAVAVLGKAVLLADRHFKKDSLLRWEIISKLVANQVTQGKLEEAANIFNSHIALVESRKPVDQNAIAVALGDMGGFLLDNAKYQEAIPYFEKATALHKANKTTSSLEAANMRLDYALALYYRGKQSESMDTLIRAKIIFDRELPESHESRVAAETLMKRLQK